MFARNVSIGLGILGVVVGLWGCADESSEALREERRAFAGFYTPEGLALPNVQLPDLNGHVHQLSDWHGKLIVMNVWASWCAPCQYEIPDLVQYQQRYGTQGLQIIGIGIDETKKLANVARSLAINYPVLVLAPERAPKFMADWGNDSGVIPHTVVIQKNGQVAFSLQGRLEPSHFEKDIIPLL